MYSKESFDNIRTFWFFQQSNAAVPRIRLANAIIAAATERNTIARTAAAAPPESSTNANASS